MKNAYAVVRVILQNAQGDVLLLRRAEKPLTGRWNLPGGKCDASEFLEDAAKREVREETGLCVQHLTYACTEDVTHYYHATQYEGTVLLNEESDAFAWAQLVTLDTYDLAFGNDQGVRRWQESLRARSCCDTQHAPAYAAQSRRQ